jgi:hypothetical protein
MMWLVLMWTRTFTPSGALCAEYNLMHDAEAHKLWGETRDKTIELNSRLQEEDMKGEALCAQFLMVGSQGPGGCGWLQRALSRVMPAATPAAFDAAFCL